MVKSLLCKDNLIVNADMKDPSRSKNEFRDDDADRALIEIEKQYCMRRVDKMVRPNMTGASICTYTVVVVFRVNDLVDKTLPH